MSDALRVDFPAHLFPITVEAFHPLTRCVVWSLIVEKPDDAVKIYIPPLRKQLGHPVAMRWTFADGSTRESEPVFAVQ